MSNPDRRLRILEVVGGVVIVFFTAASFAFSLIAKSDADAAQRKAEQVQEEINPRKVTWYLFQQKGDRNFSSLRVENHSILAMYNTLIKVEDKDQKGRRRLTGYYKIGVLFPCTKVTVDFGVKVNDRPFGDHTLTFRDDDVWWSLGQNRVLNRIPDAREEYAALSNNHDSVGQLGLDYEYSDTTACS
ncbi:hypothetical protein [Streptomyces sp. NPDC005485]|uniref:hypothetical protein n=1 Tax=Streptomyces sp. NPDC005485 TaxID=3155591 RepID=UPI0033AC97D3